MKRTQIQLDEETYEQLRKTAYERRTSMAEVIREAVAEYLVDDKRQPDRKLTLADFPWIGMGHDDGHPPNPNSTEWGDVIYEEYLEQAAEYRTTHDEQQA